jgi:hypothetical protein
VQPESTAASPFPSAYADPDSHASKADPYPERTFYTERHSAAAGPNPSRQVPAAPAPSPERPAPAKVPQKRVLAQSLQAKNCAQEVFELIMLWPIEKGKSWVISEEVYYFLF